ncbi:xylose isomerase-like TIM barrel [Ketogulonicigenium robustum]|uniref:Xylose isomerase-like TIM barrel n=1 Tax=Ketogulonicigenium robustum TaxID=92947 RepID=A0A1W6NX66_9RHOB|nr:sugar phosphate isomerase/epimerase [Ketogulonicigenium robustum]ARO13815.1 xylose isomerase-like TIM barrel [Ketogulonicigenium robustum]
MGHLIATGFNAESTDGEIDSLCAQLHALADIGVDTVELRISSVEFIAGGRFVPQRLDRLLAMLRGFAFRYTVHGLVSSNLMDPAHDMYQLEVAKRLAEFCNMIGARVLVQHSGYLAAHQVADRAGADGREAGNLFTLAEHAAPLGVHIALENIFTTAEGQYRKTPAEVARTVREIAHPHLCATIDFSHAYIESTYRGLDFYQQVAEMAPVAGHLHVHDSFGLHHRLYPEASGREAVALGIGDLHLPMGWGSIDWDRIFTTHRFLPETVLMMEISRRHSAERPQTLRDAQRLMALNASI